MADRNRCLKKIRVTRAFEVERHDVGSKLEPASTDVRYVLPRGRYTVVTFMGGYVWLQDAVKIERIHYAMRDEIYKLALTAGVIVADGGAGTEDGADGKGKRRRR